MFLGYFSRPLRAGSTGRLPHASEFARATTRGRELHAPQVTVPGRPVDPNAQMVRRRIVPELGPFHHQHARATHPRGPRARCILLLGELVEAERLECSRTNRPGALVCLAEPEQIHVRQPDRAVVEHAQVEARAAHLLRPIDSHPARERPNKGGLARAHRSLEEQHVPRLQQASEALGTSRESGFIQRAFRESSHGSNDCTSPTLDAANPRWYAWCPRLDVLFCCRSLAQALTTASVLMLLPVCGGDPPTFPTLPEPEEALRPESVAGKPPQESRIADYTLDARLDTDEHTVTGKATLTWRNRTSRTPTKLPFHLYMNAFRAEDTAWMRGARRSHRGHVQDDEFGWGYIDVTSVSLLDPAGGDPSPLSFAEGEDPTLMLVQLPEAVGPGEQVTLELEFLTRLPRVFARTGFHEDFFMIAQWYPKVGVLEEAAGWQAHVFTVHDEFYADFGNYEVHIDVPEDMIVGATGIRTEESVADGRKHLVYRAEMVHDFAWVADPQFVQHYGEHDGIRIRQLIQPEHAADADTHLAAQIFALESYEERYGPYPWTTLTIVHARHGAGGAGGMEYPTLYTTSDIARIPAPMRGFVIDERVSGVFTTVHEFGHQYFQGLFASDEHLEPWLDEGINTMANALAYEDAYGEDPWLMKLAGHPLHQSDMLRLANRGAHLFDPVDRPASAYDPLVGAYGQIVYTKAAAVMLTLRNLVGADAFDEAMRVYGERSRFRHPTGKDLEAVLLEVIGPRVQLSSADGPAGSAQLSAVEGQGGLVHLDVRDYLNQALRESSEVDFAILRSRNLRRIGTAGWHRDENGELVGGEAPDNVDDKIADLDDEDVEAVVIVQRKGDFKVPVELVVEFEDDGRERVVWDGRERHQTFTWPGRRLRLAMLDPDGKLLLEGRRTDNTSYAPKKYPDHGLQDVFGDLEEATALAILGGIGP